MILYLDLETYSECNLKQAGAARYARDPSTEVLLFAWAIGEESTPIVSDLTAIPRLPHELRDALDSDCPVVIHNSFFDRTVLREVLGIDIAPRRIIDTMVQAYSHGLPGSLGMLSQIFNLGEDVAKQKEGRQLVLQFCKPMRGKRSTRDTHPQRWQKFKEYAAHDILAMRVLRKLLPSWNYPGLRFAEGKPSPEHRLWQLDQQINDRGFLCDLELVEAAVKTAGLERETLNAATAKATGGEVEAATQRDALLAHILKEYGVALPDMRQDTLMRRVQDENLPLALRNLLELRIESSRNSSAKYKALQRSACEDGRVRGTMQFTGAATTGRWCLAEGTMVLTRRAGEVRERPIETVTLEDEVWDGDNWVPHEGVVFSGDKLVIEHDGVVATSEHKVYISSTESLSLGEAKARGLKLWTGSTTPTA